MKYITDDKPIVACSTGLSENTAIGVIRLSGFKDTSYLSPFFKINISEIEERKATFCNLYFEEKLLDEVVVTFFKGPRSYNGENILEIAAHGNIFNLKRIIDSFVNSGLFRLANNGEFTFRALKNKKLTLAQVEGLDSLLNASSAMMLDHGLDLLNGKLFKRYTELSKSYLKLKSAIELNIDFMEDVGEQESEALLNKSINDLDVIISSLYKSVSVSTKSLLSPDIVLVGEPNAGKSSLFNLILNDSRSIVSDIAGTTRDFITEYISFKNNTFRLVDTAGLRNTTDIIEEEGIKRSVNLLKDGFFKLLLININEINNFDFEAVMESKFDMIVFTHVDQMTGKTNLNEYLSKLPKADKYYIANTSKENENAMAINFGPIEPEESGSMGADNSGPIGAKNIGSIGPEKSGSMGAVNNGPMGAQNIGSIGPEIEVGSIGPGSLDIVELISQVIESKYQLLTQDDPILIDRHRRKINEIYNDFDQFKCNISSLGDIGIISSEARILESKISELIGVVSPDDVLNNIFSNFCIGK
jgi:tRNA modification GTPase